jgi:predicted nucleic acid-binding protein
MDGGSVLVLDNDGIAKAATERQVYLFLEAARRRDAPVVTTAAVLAELIRGHPRDAEFHRVLAGMRVEPVCEDLGKTAGRLIGAAGLESSEAVDAMVAATAVDYAERAEQAGMLPDVLVVTADSSHLPRLLEGRKGIRVQLV